MKSTAKYEPKLAKEYKSRIAKTMQDTYKYANKHEVPRIEKIVINMGAGDSVQDSRRAQQAADDLTLITGQKAVVTRSKKSIAQFKVRDGMPLGAKVTLRRERMYEFLDRLVNIALPRVRDFRGINGKSFDGRGNYAMGLKEHIVFPEIEYDKVEKVRGMDIIICTSAKTDEEAKALLKEFNMPFRN